MAVLNSLALKNYKDELHRIMPYIVPTISPDELDRAINYSIEKRFKNSPCSINNNYKNKTMNTDLLKMTEYLISRKPILTSYGCLFMNHTDVPNPLSQLIGEFATIRNDFKKEMFKYPIGSEYYNKYNLLQGVAKVDTNAIYGCLGAPSSIFYNIYVARSITRQGRCSITTANMLFEAFLANNVKFGSFDEIISFIDNTIEEAPQRKYRTMDIIANHVHPEQLFSKLIHTCGYDWLPTIENCEMLWQIINRIPQEEVDRIYYKNNLFDFINDSPYMNALMVDMISSLDAPFLDPNHPPKTIAANLELFMNTLKEFVYYRYQYIDKIERVAKMPRKVSLLTDTDSCFIYLDPWYHFGLTTVEGRDFPLKHYEVDKADALKTDDLNNLPVKESDEELTYDFFNDKIVSQKRMTNPTVLIPQDGLRHSIINIMAYTVGHIINDYMNRQADITNSNLNLPKCYFNMKNEFLFKKILLTDVKKNYVTNTEVQEGKQVPRSEALTIKGLAMRKVGVPESTEKMLSKILFEDILDSNGVDQFAILNKLAVIEKTIIDNIHKGSTEYFKPQRIKSINAYDKGPMKIQGIKGSVVYNALKDKEEPVIDLEKANTVLIIKTDISPKNIDSSKMRNADFEKYKKVLELFKQPYFKTGISSIAIPSDLPIPKWIIEFIDYKTIVSDNLSVFPLEPIGMERINTNSAYSGILQL